MRTTIQLDDDVAAAVEQVRRARDIGLSAAVNELIRAGLHEKQRRRSTFHQQSRRLGLRIDVSHLAEAVEHLERPPLR